MASMAVEITTNASAHSVWDTVRDVGALHTRLVPGFVVATGLVPGGRRVTFANGQVVVEPIVSLNDNLRRLVWTVQGGTPGITHYNEPCRSPREAGGSRVDMDGTFFQPRQLRRSLP